MSISNIGWNMLICGMNQPISKNRLANMEIYYPFSEFPSGTEWINLPVLGLEGHYISVEDSEKFNSTFVEFPFVRHQFNFNLKPLLVTHKEAMEDYYKLNLLKTMQYKYFMILSGYPILHPIPEGHAMLISNESDWQIDFNYTNANRRMRNSFISYFPIPTHSIVV
jgi:hypothetical protein